MLDKTAEIARSAGNANPTPALIDQIDLSISMLRTCYAAIEGVWKDQDTLMAVSHTLEHAINALQPVRDAINDAHGTAEV